MLIHTSRKISRKMPASNSQPNVLVSNVECRNIVGVTIQQTLRGCNATELELKSFKRDLQTENIDPDKTRRIEI